MSTSVPEGGSAAKPQPKRSGRRSRPRIDPNTREGMIDGLLRQLGRVLDEGRKSDFDRGLRSFIVTIESIRHRERRGRRIEWCWPEAPQGYFTTPVLYLLPEPAQVIEIAPYLARRTMAP